jgi:hypothetical protein
MVVLDEASQATEPATLVPLTRGAHCVVLAGDPRQVRRGCHDLIGSGVQGPTPVHPPTPNSHPPPPTCTARPAPASARGCFDPIRAAARRARAPAPSHPPSARSAATQRRPRTSCALPWARATTRHPLNRPPPTRRAQLPPTIVSPIALEQCGLDVTLFER